MVARTGEAVIYLVNGTSAHSVRRILAAAPGQVGVMITPAGGRRTALIEAYGCFGIDTGCYTAGDRFDLEAYLRLLDDLAPHYANCCLFATAPDVVGHARATLERSLPMLPEIRRRGYRTALVGQDGMEDLDVPWDKFDAWFTGGTTAWKLSEAAYSLAAEAKRQGKHVHMGRCNSLIRLRAAQVSGYDSADGTMLAFGPDKRARQLVGWLHSLKLQPHLREAEAVAAAAWGRWSG